MPAPHVSGFTTIGEAVTRALEGVCHVCGEDDFSPNVEAFEICGEITCDDCADEVFEANSQFGAGA